MHHNWIKRSIFWKLSYWNSNLIQHNLDVMNIKKDVFDNIFYIVMDINSKLKDNIKVRQYLKVYYNYHEIELVHNKDYK